MEPVTLNDVERSITELGYRLGSIREGRGWTLDELAERSGISKPQLSRLESGERRPSLAALLSLSKAYGVAVGAFFCAPDTAADIQVVRAEKGLPQEANGQTYWPLSTGASRFNLQPIRVVVSPGRTEVDRYSHEGEEWLFVLSGGLRVTVGARTEILSAGDSAHFDSRLPHRLDAMNNVDAELIVVACPLEARPFARPPRPAGQRIAE